MNYALIMWAAGSAPRADIDEELYDDAGVGTADTAADDDNELYQEAAETRGYGQSDSQGVCARALYDYQAGQYFASHCC